MGHTNLQELYCCQQQLNSIIDRREDNLFANNSDTHTHKNYWVIGILASDLHIFCQTRHARMTMANERVTTGEREERMMLIDIKCYKC